MPHSKRTETVALDQILRERVEGVVAEHIDRVFPRERVSAALREVLDSTHLTRAEERLLEREKSAGTEGQELLDLLIGARIECALTAGVEAAIGSADAAMLEGLSKMPENATELESLAHSLGKHLPAPQPGPQFAPEPVAPKPVAPKPGPPPAHEEAPVPISPALAGSQDPEHGSRDGTDEDLREPLEAASPPRAGRLVMGLIALLLLAGVAFAVFEALRPQSQTPVTALHVDVQVLGADGLAAPLDGVQYFRPRDDRAGSQPGSIALSLLEPLRPGTQVQLVRRAAGKDLAVAGLIATRNGNRVEIRVARPGGRQSWSAVTLKLLGENHVAYSDELSFVHIGPDAWRLGPLALEVPGRADSIIAGEQELALDPRGLSLRIPTLWTGSDTRADIETEVSAPRVRAHGGEWQSARVGERLPDGVQYEIDLDPLGLVELAGEAASPGVRVEVEATDVIGTRRHTSFSLRVVTDPLVLADFAMRDQDHIALPRNDELEFVISARAARVSLSGSFNRKITGSVTVLDERRAFVRSAPVHGREPALTLDLSGDGDYHGTILVSVADQAHYSEAYRAEHEQTYELPFVYSSKEATFEASLEVYGIATLLNEGSAIRVANSAEHVLRVKSTGDVPTQIQLTVDGFGNSVEPEFASIDAGVPSRFMLRLEHDGIATLRIQSFRTGFTRAHMQAYYRILRDSRAPLLAFDPIAFESGPIVIRADTEDPELTLWVDREDETRIGSEIELYDWKLKQLGSAEELPWGASLPDSAQPATALRLTLPHTPEDGTYEISVRARDAARNEVGQPAVLRWDVARTGPDVTLKYPQGDEWERLEGHFKVLVRIKDPNGIRAGAICRVRALHGMLPEKVIHLAPVSNGDWHGQSDFSHSWSGQLVKLSIEVKDAHGNPCAPSSSEHRLPHIVPQYPAGIARTGRDSDKITAMRIVETADRGAYEFKGQDDDAENKLFARSGLPPYAGRSEHRSWKITYEEDEIPPFYLDEYEVTNAQYLAFMYATGAGGPDYLMSKPLAPNRTTLPVVGVTWDEANDYARWVGKRLPSYVEWEYALRGGSQYRPYSSWSKGRALPTASEINAATPGAVEASFSPWSAGRGQDRTPEGLWNLSGNVSEWTSTPFYFDETVRLAPSSLKRHAAENRHRYLRPDTTSGPEFWIAGGSFKQPGYHFARNDPRRRDVRLDYVGFRCAADAERVAAGLRASPPQFVSVPAEEER